MKKLTLLFYIILLVVFSFPSESVEETAKWSKLDRRVHQIIRCESGGRQKIWGDCDKNTPHPHYCETSECAKKYHCKAYGCAQFWKDTFYWLAEKSGREGLDIESEQDQRWLLRKSIEMGYGYLWTCDNGG